jgi:hypothetical protein
VALVGRGTILALIWHYFGTTLELINSNYQSVISFFGNFLALFWHWFGTGLEQSKNKLKIIL